MKCLAVLFLLLLSVAEVKAAQNAVVITDGAMVYKKGDFDATVIGYFSVGKKVRISSKKFGPFYRVQFKQGIIGYISDVDVQTASSAKGMPRSKNLFKSGSKGHSQSLLSKRYIGLSAGLLNYTEVFNKKNESEGVTVYGLKYTVPLKFLSGPFLFDTNVVYHGDTPSYYNRTTPPSKGVEGKILVGDLQALYLLAESTKRTFGVYIGAGLAVNYSDFLVEINGSKQTLSDIMFGGVITAGIAYQLKSFVIKLEPKYYAMKSNYTSILGAIQYEF